MTNLSESSLVVLKRNSIDDASFKDTFGDIWYVDSTNHYWMFENDIWREAEEPLFKLEPIKKEGKVKMKKKEYIAKVSGNWRLVDSHELVSGRIEVPEGAEIFLLDESCGEDTLYFVKHDGGSSMSIILIPQIFLIILGLKVQLKYYTKVWVRFYGNEVLQHLTARIPQPKRNLNSLRSG